MKLFKNIFFLSIISLSICLQTEGMKRQAETYNKKTEGTYKKARIENNFSVIENVKKYLSGTELANDVVSRIATTWVRNATEYVFSQDLRSFLEIVVNACDTTITNAGYPEYSVGKFGMGFFSIFSLLEHKETDGTKIILNTAYNKNGVIKGYELTFTKKGPHDIAIILNKKTAPKQTGTRIEILPTCGEFSEKTLRVLYQYVHYLDFYPYVKTKLAAQFGEGIIINEIIGGNFSQATDISVELKPTGLLVEDFGCGIPKSVTLETLLVPSSSTKSSNGIAHQRAMALQQDPILPKFVQWKGKKDTKKSHFIITVNGVVVLDKELTRTIEINNQVSDIVISMPQATQLTLARDELAISSDGKSFEEKMLKKIIKKAIHTLITQDNNSEIFLALYYGLEQWESQTAAHHIKGLFTRYFINKLNKFIQKNDVVPVPEKYFESIKGIFNSYALDKSPLLIPLCAKLINHNYSLLEDHIEKLVKQETQSDPQQLEAKIKDMSINGKIISGKKVIFVSKNFLPKGKNGNPLITDFGLKSMLFVSKESLNSILTEGKEDEEKSYKKLARYIAPLHRKQPICSYNCKNKQTYDKKPVIIRLLDFDKADRLDVESNFITDEIFNNIRSDNPLKMFIPDDFVPEKYWSLFEILNKYPIHFDMLGINDLGNGIFKDLIRSQHSDFLLKLHENITKKDIFYCLFRLFLSLHGINESANTQKKYIKSLNIKNFKPFVLNLVTNTPLQEYFSQKNHNFLSALKSPDFTWNDQCEQEIKMCCLKRLNELEKNRYSLYLVEEQKSLKIWPLNNSSSAEEIDRLSTLLFNNIVNINTQKKLTDPFVYTHDLNDQQTSILKKVTPSKKTYVFDHMENDVLYNCPIIDGLYLHFVNDINCKEGIDTDSFDDLSKNLYNALKYADNYTESLRCCVQGIDVFKALLPIEILISFANKNPELKKSLNKVKQTILGLYDYYYSLPSKDTSFVYGEKISYAAIIPSYDLSFNDFYSWLNNLSTTEKALFEKLISFTIEDHIFQTRTDLRAKDLSDKKYYQPLLLSNTPASLLAVIANDLEESIAKMLLEVANDPQELILASYIILSSKNLEFIKKAIESDCRENIIHSLKYLMSYYIREKIDKNQIDTILQNIRPLKNISDRISTIEKQPFMESIQIYLQEVASEVTKFNNYEEIMRWLNVDSGDKCFKLSQLMKLHCVGTGISDELQRGNFEAIIESLSHYEEGFCQNKIFQSVEAGSERMPIEAIIIECIQNSIDAIRSFSLNNNLIESRVSNMPFIDHSKMITSIDVGLGWIKEDDNQENSNLVFSITDRIGMPSLKTLLTDLIIPDYSSKSPQQGAIGVMGNGTFKMYQAAKEVVILTRTLDCPNEKVYRLSIKPLRNKEGFVYDLELQCSDISHENVAKNFYGTNITVTFIQQNHTQKNTYDYLAIKSFLHDCVGAVSAHCQINNVSLPIEIYHAPDVIFDIESRSQELPALLNQKLDENDILSEYRDYNGNVCISMYERKNPLLQSYVLTGGVPFLPLSTFVSQMQLLPSEFLHEIKTGIIVNIAPSFYHPVQSRTHLKIDDQNIQKIRHALLEGLYQHVIRKGAQDTSIFNKNFTHFESKCSSLDQVALSKNQSKKTQEVIEDFIKRGTSTAALTLENFMTYYVSSISISQKNALSFCEHISNAIEVFTKKIIVFNRRVDEQKNKLIEEIKLNKTNERSLVRTILSDKLKVIYNAAKQECIDQFSAWEKQILPEKQTLNKQSILIKCVVIPWIKKKIEQWYENDLYQKVSLQSILNILPYLKEKHEIEEEAKGEDLYNKLLPKKSSLINVLNFFLKSYYESCKLLWPKELHLNNIHWVKINPNTAGFYNKQQKSIAININSNFSILSLFNLIKNIYNGKLEDIQRQDLYKDLFGTASGRIGTLIHELEHARRNESHDCDNSHCPDLDADGLDMVHFDACALSFAYKAYEAGLDAVWSEKFKKGIYEDYSLFSDYLRTFSRDTVEEIRNLERINREKLCALLVSEE